MALVILQPLNGDQKILPPAPYFLPLLDDKQGIYLMWLYIAQSLLSQMQAMDSKKNKNTSVLYKPLY